MPNSPGEPEYEPRFRALYHRAPVGIEQVALNGKLLMVNAALCEMLGYSEAELLTRTFEEITYSEDREREARLLARLLHGDLETYQLEKRYVHKNGSPVWVNLNTTLVRGADNAGFRISVVNNITERKQAEEQVKRSTALLEKFVEHAPASLAMLNRDMRYVLASKRWLEDCGVGPQNIIGRSHYEIFPGLPEHWKEAHRRGLAGETLKAEEDWTALDGQRHTIRWEIHPWGDSGRETGGIIIFLEDITASKRGEAALRRSEERLSSIVSSAMDAIITLDQELNVVVFNEAAEKIFRCSAHDAVGKSLDRFLPQRFREIHCDHIQRFAATGITSRSMSSPGTLYGLRANGEEFPLEATISQSSSGGQILYTVILRDITQKKQSEARIQGLVADRSQVAEELGRLRQVSARLLQADDQERRAIAHELHESVAQYLAALDLKLAAARKVAVSPRVRHMLDEGASLLELCSSEIRTMAYALHPSELEYFGLEPAINSHVKSFALRSGVEVSLRIASGLGRLQAEVELVLFRIMQEVLRHVHYSGRRKATVRLDRDEREITLEVTAEGELTFVNGDPPELSMDAAAIAAIRERARILGGRLQISQHPDRTTFTAILPLTFRKSEAAPSAG